MTIATFTQAISYIRVSTTDQGKSGLGLEAQRRDIDLITGYNNLTVVKEFQEVCSAKGKNVSLIRRKVPTLDDRPVLEACIKEAIRLNVPIVVSKMDRLSRQEAFFSCLMADDVHWIIAELGTVTLDPTALAVRASMAQREREWISQRTKAALAVAKEKGTPLGNPRIHEAQPIAVAALKRDADDFALGLQSLIEPLIASGKSMRAIAREFNKHKIPTKRGGTWWPGQVSDILKRLAVLKAA